MDLELVVSHGQQPGRVFAIPDGSCRTIGRALDCDIRLPDQGVSRRHCAVENLKGRLEVVDLESANGTYINGKAVQHGSLRPGDELALGPVTFECKAAPTRDVEAEAGEATLAFGETGATTVVRKVVNTRSPGSEAPAGLDELESLRRAQQNLATAHRVSKILASARDLEDLFEGVIASIFSAINADRAALLLHDGCDGSDELKVVAARARSFDQPLDEITVSRTVVRDVLENGVSSLSQDATTDARYRAGESIIKQKIRSVMCAPVATDDAILGVLYADSRSLTGAFSESDLELLALIGNHAGIAIHRAQLIEQSESFFFNTIRAIVATIDAKDGYTHRHSERVAAFATRIAREMGLSEEEVEAVELAGLLHDVGKIGVPEAILHKSGPLTDTEFEEVKRHPIHAVGILTHIENPRMAAILSGVRHHHEKWDGSGYPEGLKGDEIPLIGRLLAVADVLDALGSDRAYRKPLAFEEIVAKIQKDAGVHFDPAVVDAVTSLHERGELDVPTEWNEPASGTPQPYDTPEP